MIPTTISELAKRHKRLTDNLAEKFAISYDEMEIMEAVDLVLDSLVKVGKRKKEKEGNECLNNHQRGLLRDLQALGSRDSLLPDSRARDTRRYVVRAVRRDGGERMSVSVRDYIKYTQSKNPVVILEEHSKMSKQLEFIVGELIDLAADVDEPISRVVDIEDWAENMLRKLEAIE